MSETTKKQFSSEEVGAILDTLTPNQRKLVKDEALLARAEFAIDYCITLLDDGYADHAQSELKIMSRKIKSERLPWTSGPDNPFVISARLNQEKESA